MKTRFGHVSNSSTSSFVVYLKGLPEEKINGLIQAMLNHNEET